MCITVYNNVYIPILSSLQFLRQEEVAAIGGSGCSSSWGSLFVCSIVASIEHTTIQHCTVLHHTTLQYTAVYCTTLHCIALHSSVLQCPIMASWIIAALIAAASVGFNLTLDICDSLTPLVHVIQYTCTCILYISNSVQVHCMIYTVYRYM